MDGGTFIAILLGVIGSNWGLFIAVGGYYFKRIDGKLDELGVHRETCIRVFADRDRNASDHRELYRRTDDHENRLTRLETLQERKGQFF